MSTSPLLFLSNCMRPPDPYYWKVWFSLSGHPFPELSKSPVGLFSPKEMEVEWCQPNFLMLEAGSGIEVLAGPTCCCFSVTLSSAAGVGVTHLIAAGAQLLGCPGWSRFLPGCPMVSPVGHQGNSFLRHPPMLTLSLEDTPLWQVAGLREEVSCDHTLIPSCHLPQISRSLCGP